MYFSFCTADLLQKTLQMLPRKVCLLLPRFLCQSLLLYGSVQYGLSQQIKQQHSKQKMSPWDLCPNSLGKCANLLLTFLSKLSSEIYLTLFFSFLAHYPMHSFIISEDDLLPPKCLFTFPNPKSKGQDLILPLQDQGP
jgi:hypothetical protein